MFIQTSSGLINARYVVRIGALCARSSGNFHEIEYVCGEESRETRATEEAVQEFLDSEES